MPRPPASKATGRDDLRLSPELGVNPPPDRWFEPRRQPAKAAGEKSVFPVYAGPLSIPRRGKGIKRHPPRETHAPAVSDRTWPVETREHPRSFPAYPPHPPHRPLQEGPGETERKPMVIIRAANAPSTPKLCLAGSDTSAKGASRKISLLPRATPAARKPLFAKPISCPPVARKTAPRFTPTKLDSCLAQRPERPLSP